MGHYPLPVRMFIESLQKWLHSIEAGTERDARFYADQIEAVGQMLAFDPEFKQLFKDRVGSCMSDNSEDVLKCIHAYLHAATDAALNGTYRNGGSHAAPQAPGGATAS